jgi:hypothetical protein
MTCANEKDGVPGDEPSGTSFLPKRRQATGTLIFTRTGKLLIEPNQAHFRVPAGLWAIRFWAISG